MCGIFSIFSKDGINIRLLVEIMDDLNISHMSNSYARELSGGQKKLLELGI